MKSLGDFHKHTSRRDRLASWCKSCVKINTANWYAKNRERRRNDSTLRYHGITLAEYQRLRSEQATCPVCLRPLDSLPTKQVHLDHNHRTGKIRGFLCSTCNTALGLAREDPQILSRLAAYIREGQTDLAL